jgi:hypothetical protein
MREQPRRSARCRQRSSRQFSSLCYPPRKLFTATNGVPPQRFHPGGENASICGWRSATHIRIPWQIHSTRMAVRKLCHCGGALHAHFSTQPAKPHRRLKMTW